MAAEFRITDADLQQLLAESPLANEQMRRIVAEREKAELLKQLELAHSCECQPEPENGTVKNVEAVLADN